MAKPTHLVIVTYPKVEVFSAHCSEAAALAVKKRISGLIASTARQAVHVVEIPDAEGIVEKVDVADDTDDTQASEQPACEPLESPPQKFIKPQAAPGDEDANGIISDSPDRNYQGAFS